MASLSSYPIVAAGQDFTMFVKPNGNLLATGNNIYGQIGNGFPTQSATPTILDYNVSSVYAGEWDLAYIKSDSSLLIVGRTFSSMSLSTASVQIDTNVVSASVGGGFGIYLKNDGTTWGFGFNQIGQFGIGSKSGMNLIYPAIQLLTNIKDISAGEAHALYLKTDNTLWGSGWNMFGQLGIPNSTSSVSSPVLIDTNVLAISAGRYHSLYIKNDGTLWFSGMYAKSIVISSPPLVLQQFIQSYFSQLDSLVDSCSGGSECTLYVKSNGTLFGMGTFLGVNLTSSFEIDTNVIKSFAGINSNFFVKNDHSVWGMGSNNYGQLGDGTTNNSAEPILIMGPEPTPTPTSTPTSTPSPTPTPTPTPTATPTSTPTSTPSPPTPTPRPVVRLKCATPTIKKLSPYKLEISHTGLPYYNWNIFWIVYRYPQGGIISRGTFSSGKVVVDLVDADNVLVAQCNDGRSVYIPSATVRTYSTIKQ